VHAVAPVAVWGHRNVLWLLIQRDLTLKYQSSALGYFWSLLEPLAMAGTYWFVFGVLYDTQIGPDGGSYPLFLISGLFAWMWVNSALAESTGALTAQARLITTMKVPRQVFPIARSLGRGAEYLAGLPILIGFAIAFHAPFGASLLALPLALVLQAILLVGLALFIAPLNVLFRDVERMMRLVQRLLFYAAPVIYPLDLVTGSGLPGWVQAVYLANPLVGVFQLHHAAWYPAEFPSTGLLATSVVGCLAVFFAGWWTFRRLEPAVLKEL
jgi:ABC-2 type transport system permease protein